MDADSLVFRLGENAPEMLREVCEELGWREFESDEDDDENWNLWWKASGFRTSDFEYCRPWQRLNHFPKSCIITRKDSLARNLRKMRWIYGSGLYNFAPMAFNLPNDYKKFVAEYSKQKEGKKSLWICKPADQSRGRGIFLFRELKDLTYNCAAVVQKYIPNPLLISGYKFDLRLYVLVTSFHPFNVYIYHEGLVRFGTEKFDLTSTDNVFSHLTNTSINKFGPSYSAEKDRVGVGCKWSLNQLRIYFHQHSIDDRLLWQRITSLIILTLLMQAPEVQSNRSSNCFELFGFDVLVDDNLKPWLLEVNFSPALGNDCPLDVTVKKPMLHDMIQALGLTEGDVLQATNKKQKCRTQKSRLSARKNSLVKQRTSLTKPIPHKHSSNTYKCKVQEQDGNCESKTPTGDVCLEYDGHELPSTEEDIEETCHSEEVDDDVRESDLHSTMPQLNSIQNNVDGIEISIMADLMNSNELKLSKTKASLEFLAAFERDISCKLVQSNTCPTSRPVGADLVYEEANPRQSVKLRAIGVDPSTESISKDEKLPSVVGRMNSTLAAASVQSGRSRRNGKLGRKSSLRIRRTQSVITSRAPEDFIRQRLSTTAASLRSSSGRNVSHSGSMIQQEFTGRHCPLFLPKRQNPLSCKDAKPAPQYGNYILVFPFNESTSKAAQGSINVKVIVEEVRMALKTVTQSLSQTPEVGGRKDRPETLELDKPFWGFRPYVYPKIT